jgi:putative membrane protein insertion efficiency factor
MNGPAGHLRATLAAAPRLLLLGLVKAYRLLIGPALGPGCRFEPSCSAYALQSLEQHGALGGTYLTLHRLVRCQPWCQGGHDPVPESAPRPFRALVSNFSQKKSS